MTTLHINGWIPPAIAVAIALHEKGVAFDLAQHRWQDSATALGAFAGQLEPFNSMEGEFPVLVDGSAAINDSYFILEFLDDRYLEPPLKPAGAYGQWQVQALARFFGERALPAVSSLGVASCFTPEQVPGLTQAASLTPERRDAWLAALDGEATEPVIEESGRKIGLLFDRLEHTLADSGGPWLLGTQFTLVDIEAFVLAHPFLAGQLPPVAVMPGMAVRDWHERISQRASVQAVLADIRPSFLPGPEHARWG